MLFVICCVYEVVILANELEHSNSKLENSKGIQHVLKRGCCTVKSLFYAVVGKNCLLYLNE